MGLLRILSLSFVFVLYLSLYLSLSLSLLMLSPFQCLETDMTNRQLVDSTPPTGEVEWKVFLKLAKGPLWMLNILYIPLNAQYENIWKGKLNSPLKGRLLPNPSPLWEATQLMQKLDQLAGFKIPASFDNVYEGGISLSIKRTNQGAAPYFFPFFGCLP